MQWKKYFLFFTALVCIVNFGLLAGYEIIGYKTFFHSDAATKVLLAGEIVRSGNFFPNDWNYVNGDLFILFGHALIVPLLIFMKPGFATHAIAGIMTSALILIAVCLLLNQLKVSILRRILVLAVFSGGFSGFAAENLYGQTAYGAIFFIACILIWLTQKIFNDAKTLNVYLFSIFIFLLITFATWSNPLRALVSYVVPLLFAILMVSHKKIFFSNKDAIRLGVWVGLIIIIATVVGYFLHQKTLSQVNVVMGVASARWLSYAEMSRNLSLLGQGILAILGGLPPANEPILSAWGFYYALRLLVAIGFIALLPFALCTAVRAESRALNFLAYFSIAAFLIALFVQVCTSIPEMSNPIQSSRYLVPAILLFVIIVLIQKIDFKNSFVTAFGLSSIILVLIVSAAPTFFRSNLNSDPQLDASMVRENRAELIRFLRANKLGYGYSGYWVSGDTSVLSDGESLVRQIVIEGGLPKPMRHLSSDSWYEPEAWNGETFLMLTTHEASLINWSKMNQYGAFVLRQLEFNGYLFFIFADNIAKHLPGWTVNQPPLINYYAESQSLKTVGTFVSDFKRMGPVIIANASEIGALHYGPYAEFSKGVYEITFDVNLPRSTSFGVRLDIAAFPNQTVLKQESFNELSAPHVMKLELEKKMALEFRVWTLGVAPVIFRSIQVKKIE